jgi:hypothetical protein
LASCARNCHEHLGARLGVATRLPQPPQLGPASERDGTAVLHTARRGRVLFIRAPTRTTARQFFTQPVGVGCCLSARRPEREDSCCQQARLATSVRAGGRRRPGRAGQTIEPEDADGGGPSVVAGVVTDCCLLSCGLFQFPRGCGCHDTTLQTTSY